MYRCSFADADSSPDSFLAFSLGSVKEALQSKSVNDEISKEFIETLHNCEFARFAPGDNATKMDKIYKESINIITKTERELK